MFDHVFAELLDVFGLCTGHFGLPATTVKPFDIAKNVPIGGKETGVDSLTVNYLGLSSYVPY